MTEPAIVRRSVPSCDALPATLHPVIRRVLAARGAVDAAALDVSLEGLHRTDSMSGIDTAVSLLEAAVVRNARITIVADFDADGATSCALAIRALRAMGAGRVAYIVPNRFEYGYGLTTQIVELAAAREPDLLITVDNGISSLEGVAAARAAGIDVLITDHHLPGDQLPDANAIVDPNVPGDLFPSKTLAGVGVIFYVMLALRKRLQQRDWFVAEGLTYPHLGTLLDLVALGTVADVVPLDQNNRRLVAQGLARIRAGKSQPGVAALLRVAGRDIPRVTSTDLAFTVAPRLNAAGRLADMSLGIECLIADDKNECDRAAAELDDLNRERREIESEMKTKAMAIVESMPLSEGDEQRCGLCLFDEQWHQGVVGIIASRIKDRYHRPVIVFAPAGGQQLKGSGRSIHGVHLRDALDSIAAQNPGLLSKFGGHAMAAGLTLPAGSFADFSDAFDAEIRRQVGDSGIVHEIVTDGELRDEDFSLALAEQLAEVAPWGREFPEPLFDGAFVVIEKRIVGENHVRMRLQPRDGTKSVNAIAFGAADEVWVSASTAIYAAYRLSVNEYRGARSLQIVVEHARDFTD